MKSQKREDQSLIVKKCAKQKDNSQIIRLYNRTNNNLIINSKQDENYEQMGDLNIQKKPNSIQNVDMEIKSQKSNKQFLNRQIESKSNINQQCDNEQASDE